MKYEFDKAWKSDSALKALVHSLESAGGVAYLVGGCVRNTILGKPFTDIDIATDLLPEQVVSISKKEGYKVIQTGISYGTVTIVNAGRKFEVTTFRSDIKTYGRKASVKFTSEMKLDAMRRDFTMNSIYMTVSGEIIDPLGSLDDLLEKKIKFIGNPSERIEEDNLRILRFFRFLAEFNKGRSDIDQDTMEALYKYKKEVKSLSRERIWMELKRILSVPEPQHIFSIMIEEGILDEVLPPIEVEGLSKVITAEKKYSVSPSHLVRLFSLNKSIGKKWAHHVSLTSNEAKMLEFIKESLAHYNDLKTVAYKFGRGVAEGWLLNFHDGSFDVIPSKMSEIINTGCNAFFPISGVDLLEEMEEGPELGRQMERLEKLWIKSGFKMSKEELLSKSKS